MEPGAGDDRPVRQVGGCAGDHVPPRIAAFAVFRYERQSVGSRWHEPAWRPSLIGWVGLLVSLGLAIGWHGLRLAIYIARVWTGEL